MQTEKKTFVNLKVKKYAEECNRLLTEAQAEAGEFYEHIHGLIEEKLPGLIPYEPGAPFMEDPSNKIFLTWYGLKDKKGKIYNCSLCHLPFHPSQKEGDGGYIKGVAFDLDFYNLIQETRRFKIKLDEQIKPLWPEFRPSDKRSEYLQECNKIKTKTLGAYSKFVGDHLQAINKLIKDKTDVSLIFVMPDSL